jgi:hypothetical protein
VNGDNGTAEDGESETGGSAGRSVHKFAFCCTLSFMEPYNGR